MQKSQLGEKKLSHFGAEILSFLVVHE